VRISAILTIGLLALAVAGAARAEGAHVTCVGDSITYGSGTANPATDSYPAQLQGLLGAGYAVQNDGHSGATMLVTGDLPYTTTAEYTASTSWAAAGGDVVIMLGTNDSKPVNWSKKASFEPDCESLVAHYQAAAGKPRVWVNLPPPAFAGACCKIDGTVIQNEILPLLKQCATAKGASTIDVFGALSGQGAHFADGVHPDNAGALMIAQTVQAALAKQPTVALSTTSASFTLPSPVKVKTNATAAYGKIEQVEIFEGTTSLAKSSAASADFGLNLAAGTHALFAVATETGGRTAKSSPPLSVTVQAAAGSGPAPAPNASPAPGPSPTAGPSPAPGTSPAPGAGPAAASPTSASSATPAASGGEGSCAVGRPRSSSAFALAFGLALVWLARRRTWWR
jgi:lysophospholipase L1-like esterase